MVQLCTLKNGVQLVLEDIPYVKSIALGIWVKNGSRNESKIQNGISHFIEHMMFKGTDHRTAKEIAEEMDAVGGQINAFTTKEYTCYHTRVLDKHFDKAWDILCDLFFHSSFADEEIEKEKSVILEEIGMYQDSPEDIAFEQLQKAVWSNSPLGMPILGTEETISHFTGAELRQYYSQNYIPAKTVISVAGNFDRIEMQNKLQSQFESWEGDGSSPNAGIKTEYKPAIALKEKDTEQVHLCLACPGISSNSENRFCFAVFNTIFGGGLSSRLFQKIREEKGLVYSIYSFTQAYQETGLYSMAASMNATQVEEVLYSILNEIKNLSVNKITEKEIQLTKQQLISNLIISDEGTGSRMSSNGGSLLIRGKIQDVNEMIEKIEAVSQEDVEKVIHSVLRFPQFSLSAVGRIKGLKLEKIVEEARLYPDAFSGSLG